MAFALRAVHSIAASAPLRAAASRRFSARVPSAARVATRAMADEAAEGPPVHELVDVRVGKVLKCYKHEEADKLYVEEVDVGEEEPRQICSGLVPYMNAEVRRPERTERAIARGRGERTRADPSPTRSTRSVGDQGSIRFDPLRLFGYRADETRRGVVGRFRARFVSSTNERTSERATNERLPLLLDETNS